LNQVRPFAYASDNKRYHTWNYHLRGQFGHKVFKVALDGGLTVRSHTGAVHFAARRDQVILPVIGSRPWKPNSTKLE
jgi:hypothetical protein